MALKKRYDDIEVELDAMTSEACLECFDSTLRSTPVPAIYVDLVHIVIPAGDGSLVQV